jgi:hypothetical protein
MYRRASTGRLVVFIFVGLIIGGVLGECIGLVFAQIGQLTSSGWDTPMRSVFVKGLDIDLGFADPKGFALDLYLIKLRLGFGLKINLISILGMGIALYLEKWSREH